MTHPGSTPNERGGENREAYAIAYKEVCASYHAIDDFRAKRLGLLPFVSGIGILVLVNDGVRAASPALLVFAGLFGSFITVGLFLYEVHALQDCTNFINRGIDLEHALRLGDKGQFAHWGCWPLKEWGRFQRFQQWASFEGAARVIYPTVFAGWVFVASSPLSRIDSSWGWDALPPVVGVVAAVPAFAAAWRMTDKEPPLCRDAPNDTMGARSDASAAIL